MNKNHTSLNLTITVFVLWLLLLSLVSTGDFGHITPHEAAVIIEVIAAGTLTAITRWLIDMFSARAQ